MLRVASFFAGIGGFDKGFEGVGMNIVFQCEINSFCQEILRQHWPDTPIAGDIQNVTIEEIPHAQLWSAGFPCQDVSLANQGKRQGLEGSRSGLFHHFAGLIEQLPNENRPTWVLLENVPGLLNSNNGDDFRTILQRLSTLGYNVSWRVLDAKYFGTPQRRRRVYILGSLNSPKCVNVLFEPGFTIASRQGLGFKDIDPQSLLGPFNSYYVFQHATINRKVTAGPQAKGYRNDGETYTFDSRGSSDVICSTTRPFICSIPTQEIKNSKDSSRYRTVGNAVNINVIEWIGSKILEVDRVPLDSNQIEETYISLGNSLAPINIFETNIKKWANSGLVINSDCIMGNILEHSNEPRVQTIDSVVLGITPINYFLNSTQLQSMLDRANARGERLPEDLEGVIIRQRDVLYEHPQFDTLLHKKTEWNKIDLPTLEIPVRLRENLFVRRMTPQEYEQIQGFPAGWTRPSLGISTVVPSRQSN